MTAPLSVLLPVHNAQATLSAEVAKLLDALPELAAWFELLIIDDGSTDATCEIAEELVTEFPQVQLLRHAMRRGVEGSWRVGLQRTDAPIVIGYNGRAGIEPAAIFQLLKKAAPVDRGLGEQSPTSSLRELGEPNLPSPLRGRGAGGEGAAGAGAAVEGAGGGAAPARIETNSRLIRWLAARSIAGESPTVGGFCLLRREAELPPIRKPGRWRIEPRHFIQTTPQAAPAGPLVKPRPIPTGRTSAPAPTFLSRLRNLAIGE